MGTVFDNINYYEKYDWSESGEEWSAPWGGTRSMWLASIYPRIRSYLPADRVVEIGAGHGRIAKILHAFTAEELVLIDIMPECVDACRKVFAVSAKTRCLHSDGCSLPEVDDFSTDLVFSFYSLVGADRATLSAYLGEIDRVLGEDGVAFLHHSNAAHYWQPANGVPDKRIRLLAAYRDISVNAQVMREIADDNNLRCIKQECVEWDIQGVMSDCFSTIVRPGSRWDMEFEIIHNTGFRDERCLAVRRARSTKLPPRRPWRIL
jgi:ubiquinone/menaquinone biosynthesis C-methylase UbiE